MRIYIRGAYGPGNIGDDVLMIATINLAKKIPGKNNIYVGVDHPELAKLIDNSVNWVHIKKPIVADLAIHGGGGQFFSFEGVSKKGISFIEKIAISLSRQTSVWHAFLRVIFKLFGATDGIYFAKNKAAFCIGMGPFSVKNRDWFRAKKIIPRFDYISVRDKVSAKYAEDFGFKDAKIFSDPSMLRSLWDSGVGDDAFLNKSDNSIYYIIRDWPHSESGASFIDEIFRSADYMAKCGFSVKMVSLYEERDKHLIDSNIDRQWIIWKPGEVSPADFMKKIIGENSVIVTARAHGAWLSAVLGEPSVIVEIEPKLDKVHKMLPNGTILVKECGFDYINDAINKLIKDKKKYRSGVRSDVDAEAIKINEAVNDFIGWVSRSN